MWSKPSAFSTRSSSWFRSSIDPAGRPLLKTSSRSPSISNFFPIRLRPRFVQASTPSFRQTFTVTRSGCRRSSPSSSDETRGPTWSLFPCTSVVRSTPSAYWARLVRWSASDWLVSACVRTELSTRAPIARISALASRKTRKSVSERSAAARMPRPLAANSLMSLSQLSAPAAFRLRLRNCRRGLGSRLLRDLRLRADRAPGSHGPARAPRRRAAALRLRRGHATPVAALGGRPGGAARGLRLAFPRRPLPRPAGNAEDVRAARARGADHGLRAAWAEGPVLGTASRLREADVRARARRAAPRRRARTGRVQPRHVSGRAPRRVAGLRAHRASAPGPVRRDGFGCPRRAVGAGTRVAAGRGVRPASGRPDRHARRRARPAAGGPEGRAQRRYGLVADRDRGGARGGGARARGDVSRRGTRARP